MLLKILLNLKIIFQTKTFAAAVSKIQLRCKNVFI